MLPSAPLRISLVRLITCWCIGICAAVAGHPGHALTLDDLDPPFAAVGDEVELAASGLDPFESYTLTVAGAPATVTLVEANRLRFVVPTGASSGSVELALAGDPTAVSRAPFELTVVRPLDASLDPAFGASVSGYTLGSAVGDSAGPGPNFSIDVPIGEIALAIAAGSNDQSLLLQVVTDSTTSAQITAHTTAQALVFTTPTVLVSDLTEATARLATIDALPETAALAELVSSSLAAGRDYLDATAFRSRFLAATRAFEETQQLPPLALVASAARSEDFTRGGRSFAPGYPRDLPEAPQLSLLNRLDVATTAPGATGSGVPTLGVKWNATEALSIDVPVFGRIGLKINPVDWIAGLYQLSPGQFPGGIAEVDALVADGTAYSRLKASPVGHLVISSKDPTRFVDIRGMLTSLITSRLKPVSDLRIQSDRSALYMVRKFSGAHYPSQDGLLAALPDGRVQASRALALNLFVAALDTMGIFSSKLGGKNRKDMVRIGFDVYLTMERIVEERSRSGTLSADDILAIRLEGLSLFLRKLEANAAFFSTRTALGKLTGKGPKFFSHIAKVATVGKIVSRSLALWNFPMYPNVNIVQGVESTAVAVGNPWRPEITSFSPKKGHLGTVVTLRGQNFSSVPAENLVEFNAPLSTDPNLPPTVPAEVTESTFQGLMAAVPANAARGPGSISIQRADRGKFWTSENDPPFDSFEVLPQPIVTAIEPGQYIPGSLVRVVGSNFSEDMTRNIVILSDSVWGDASYRTEPLAGSTTELLFRDPSFPFPGTVTLRVQVEAVLNPNSVVDASNEIPYNRRPAPSGSTGRIFVTSYLDNVTADNQITLREAIHIGAGTLGRALTTCPTDPDGCEREHVLDNDGFVGVGVRESIILHPFLAEGGTINLALGSLPGIEGGDAVGILAIVDGGGGAFSGLTINGQTGVSVTFLRFQNFGQHGVHLIDAPEAYLGGVQVAGCGGTGILAEGNTTDVQIVNPLVSSCAGPGLHLSGAGVQRVACSGGTSSGMRDNGGDGILVSGGSSANLVNCGNVSGSAGAGIRVTGSPLNGIGDSSRSAILTNKVISNNLGGGVVIDESPGARVFRLDVRGNGSHGIVIGGPGTTDVEVQAVQVGTTRDAVGSADPNQGHGILIHNGASGITIGTRAIGGINEPAGSLVAGNTGFGILITGPDTTDIVVNRTVVGASQASDFSLVARGNTLGGIALQDFAHHNRLGDREAFGKLDIVGHTTTVGVLIEGGAHDNHIFGANFGSIESGLNPFMTGPDYGNFYGIRIRDGAHSNVIGARGSSPAFQGNWFRWSEGAGVLLESGGFVSGTQTPGVTPTPTNANVLINNRFGTSGGENVVGVLLRAGAQANRIGGVDGDSNDFQRNTKAGIWIDGYAIAEPHLANRIIGNSFMFMSGPNLPADPLVAVPDGVGVLLTNASGHVIGGPGVGERNRLLFNYVGIYDDGGSGNRIVGNDIGSSAPSAANKTAGVILSATTDCTVGPDNEIMGNGQSGPGPALGGIAIHGGSGNSVWGNAIGTNRGWTQDSGNSPHGILVDDAAQTVIGALGLDGPNVIGNNLGPGVLIAGPGALGNQIINSWIGEAPTGAPLPNTGSGVQLASGARDNKVGDEFAQPHLAGAVAMPAGNRILGNGGHGVHIQGAGTVSNTVTGNSISGNALAGIRLEGGGNNGLPAPTITSYSGQRAFGTVAAAVPDGSLVQLFSDDDGEGRILVGEGPVSAGQFAVATGFVTDDLTATVTHDDAISSVGRTDTSEFSTFFPAPISLFISFAADPPAVLGAAPGDTGALVLPLELTAINGPVKVLSLTLDVLGSVVDDVDILQVVLYRDVDGDGLLGADDEPISDPGSFDVDDGSVTLALGTGVSIDTLSSQTWLVAIDLSATAVIGSNLELSVPSATAVSAGVMLAPSIPVSVVGIFPIASTGFTLIEGNLDSDSDGVVDVADVCPGTLVGEAVDDVGCSCAQLDVTGSFPTGDPFLCPEPGADAMLLGAIGALCAIKRGRARGASKRAANTPARTRV